MAMSGIDCFTPRRTRVFNARRPDRGMSLIFALMGLSVLLLCAAALVRSVDTGVLVLGNLGFKRDATVSSDQTAERAISWLSSNPAALDFDGSANSGYYASSYSNLDPTGSNTANASRAVIDWDGDGCSSYGTGSFSTCLRPLSPAVTINGNTSQYLVTRLCYSAGAPSATNDCAVVSSTPSVNPDNPAKNSVDYGHQRLNPLPIPSGSSGTYYRIIVRTKGAKDTVSFTETIVHF